MVYTVRINPTDPNADQTLVDFPDLASAAAYADSVTAGSPQSETFLTDSLGNTYCIHNLPDPACTDPACR